MNLEAAAITVGYPPHHEVFRNISFSAVEGDMIALLGVNGIGKSTLLRTLAGLQPAFSGSITIGGKPVDQLSAAAKATHISIVLTDKIRVDHITVRQLISLGRAPYTGWIGQLRHEDEEIIREVIAWLHLQKMEHQYFNRLSDGEKQKVWIARALCQQTPVVILDEPTAFLDFRNKREIMDILRQVSSQLHKIVLLSTHDIEAALTYCNKCWIMTEQRQFVEVQRSPAYKAEVENLLQVNVPH